MGDLGEGDGDNGGFLLLWAWLIMETMARVFVCFFFFALIL